MSETPHSAHDSVYDVGLAVERTALSWQRTILAVVVATALATRYTADAAPVFFPLTVGTVGVLSGITALLWVRRRYRNTNRHLHEHGNLAITDGVPISLVTLSILSLTVLVFIFVYA
ncbi:DUF202 domain-containing protein [Timonella sp. A28]|uniref:DUF202 domain-containing protein n=1 Tax=Timonella sp. A28 TaxID=3442640 RepID=UPI003EBFC4DF